MTFLNMFSNAHSFNQDIGGWNVANATTFEGMFNNARVFDQDIGGWNTAKATASPQTPVPIPADSTKTQVASACDVETGKTVPVLQHSQKVVVKAPHVLVWSL